MKTLFLLVFVTIGLLGCKQYSQPVESDDYSYYKFYDDSITINIYIDNVNESIMINNMLTLTEMFGIEYWNKMRDRGVRFINEEVDVSFDKQLRYIWLKQEEKK